MKLISKGREYRKTERLIFTGDFWSGSGRLRVYGYRKN